MQSTNNSELFLGTPVLGAFPFFIFPEKLAHTDNYEKSPENSPKKTHIRMSGGD